MIHFKNVVKRFGDRTILKGISFDLDEGEILFILGTSGTGKSVLLKTIVGLLRSDEGEIYIDHQEVTKLSEADFAPIRKKCGMVFQHPALFDSMTIFDNVAFGLRKHFKMSEAEIKVKVRNALTMVHLTGIENKYPSEISYGMQKRVSLARTVAIVPRVLLFDEPTTGLDPVTTNAVNMLIRDLSHTLGATSIVVSHDMACALAIANKIIVLDQGNIVAQGTPQEILQCRVPLVEDFLIEVKNDSQLL